MDDPMIRQISALSKKYNVVTMDFIDGDYAGKGVPVIAVMMAHLASISMLLAGIKDEDREEDLAWFVENAAKKLADMSKASRDDYVAYRQKRGV